MTVAPTVALNIGAALRNVASLTLLLAGCSEAADPVLTTEQRLELDDRIAGLIAPCDEGKLFSADTSDMVRVLANNLVFSVVEPLRRSRAELAEIGAEAVGELRRVFDEAYADRWAHGVLENVLGVCALMEVPDGMPIVREGLRHPNELVRLAALDAATKHGSAEDYEAILVNVNIASSTQNRADFARALQAVDPDRFYLEFIGWLERGEFPDLWSYLGPAAAKATDPVVLSLYAELVDLDGAGFESSLPGNVAPFLVAAIAASGDERALAQLREELTSDLGKVREIGLRATEEVGLVAEIPVVMEHDDLESMRARAAKLIGTLGDESFVEILRGGLSDPGANVRAVCLEQLLIRGDGSAQAMALEMLRQGIQERADGMRALRLGWEANPEAPQRAYDVLTDLLREQAGTGDAASVGLLQHLSQVPTRAAAEFIMTVGRTSDSTIRGWPAHRWCAFQTYNVGPIGLAYLRELHAAESDPIRRVDYLTAIWQDHSDEARELLRGVILDERSLPQEVIYAADLLVRVGPAQDQAPFLKRAVYLKSTQERIRPALQCLLWRWYGS